MKTLLISFISTSLFLGIFSTILAIPCHTQNDHCKGYEKLPVRHFVPSFSESSNFTSNNLSRSSEEYGPRNGETLFNSADTRRNISWLDTRGPQNKDFGYQNGPQTIYPNKNSEKLRSRGTSPLGPVVFNWNFPTEGTGGAGRPGSQQPEILVLAEVFPNQEFDGPWKTRGPDNQNPKANSTANTPVPEPSTFLLLGSGFLGMAVYLRKRGKK